MYTFCRLILVLILLSSCAEKTKTFLESEIAILPQPSSLVIGESSFALKDEVTAFGEIKEAKQAIDYFIRTIKDSLKINLKKTDNKNADIVFKLDNSLTDEAYNLNIVSNQIAISANSYGGFLYGIQSIKQLISKDINDTKYLIPSITIKDKPRFKWRAYMLDESRYFHGEKFVKQMLDQMALLKMNVFHWHLVDDAGWRIEIKKYPKLTEVGSKRDSSQINHEGKRWKSTVYDGKPHSGFYTQEQIKDIVAYATERNITIVPEFEMPGHSSAAIAAYTWLGTAGENIDVPVKFGRLYDNYDVTKPEVIQFIKDVLKEMFELFPSEFTKGNQKISINGLIWMGDTSFMQQQIKEKLQQGFTTIKMKIGAIDFDTEINLLKSIRKEFSSKEIELRVDANGAFTSANALEKLQRLSALELHSIEQPIKQGQWQEMASLCEKTPLPIALDEELIGVFSSEEKEKCIQTIQPQFIILKPSLIGGFKGSKEWISIAKKYNADNWITSALESNVGLNAIAQFTHTLQNKLPQGLGTGGLFTNNFESPLEVLNGSLQYNPSKKWDFNS